MGPFTLKGGEWRRRGRRGRRAYFSCTSEVSGVSVDHTGLVIGVGVDVGVWHVELVVRGGIGGLCIEGVQAEEDGADTHDRMKKREGCDQATSSACCLIWLQKDDMSTLRVVISAPSHLWNYREFPYPSCYKQSCTHIDHSDFLLVMAVHALPPVSSWSKDLPKSKLKDEASSKPKVVMNLLWAKPAIHKHGATPEASKTRLERYLRISHVSWGKNSLKKKGLSMCQCLPFQLPCFYGSGDANPFSEIASAMPTNLCIMGIHFYLFINEADNCGELFLIWDSDLVQYFLNDNWYRTV